MGCTAWSGCTGLLRTVCADLQLDVSNDGVLALSHAAALLHGLKVAVSPAVEMPQHTRTRLT